MEMQEEYWEQWYNAIENRYSVRKYNGEAIDDRSMSILMERASMLSTLYEDVRISVPEAASEKPLEGLSGISGARVAAAFIAKFSGEQPYKHIGFIGEKFILECTAQGIKTCWVGGGFGKKHFEDMFEMGDNEKILAVIPMGYSDIKPSFTHNDRLPIDDISDLNEHHAMPEGIKEAVEMARLAPSSMNRQPWFFQVSDESIIIKKRTSALFGAKMLEIDLGIAAAHVDIVLNRFGLGGQITFNDNDIIYSIN